MPVIATFDLLAQPRKQIDAELSEDVDHVDGNPILDQQIAFASPPIEVADGDMHACRG